jgi:hypothetical protein
VWHAINEVGGGNLAPQQSGGDISGTSHVITGLEKPGGDVVPALGWFKVLVYAKNSAGRSPSAEWNGNLVPMDRLLIMSYGDGWVELDTNQAGGTGDQHVIYAGLEDDQEAAWEALRGIDNNRETITGLTNGRTYYFWIQIVTDDGGEGDWSESVSCTPHIVQPTITLISGDTSIEVSWGSISSADFYEVWYYETSSASAPGTDNPGIKAADNLLSSPYIITDLDNGTEYAVYVKAKSEYDARDSAAKTAIPRPVPVAPAAPVLAPGIGQIEASWDAAGDPSVTSYEILYHTANESALAKKYAEVPGTSVVIKGLDHNTTYYVWLRAKSSAGSSFYSLPATGKTFASGAIAVGFNGGVTVTDGGGADVSGGFVITASGSVTLSAAGDFADVKWHVDGITATGNTITLSGALYNAQRDHSVTFTGKKDGILYSSDPISFRISEQ